MSIDRPLSRVCMLLLLTFTVSAVCAQQEATPSADGQEGRTAGNIVGELGQKLRVYPNPFRDVLTVELSVPSERMVYVDFIEPNANNIIQLSVPYAEVMHLNTTQIPPGNYLATIKGGSGQVYGKWKLVKPRN